jgi:hypothetical protein
VSFPDDANISDLGSISPNLSKLSTNDTDDSLGLGAPHQQVFERLGFLTNDQVDSSSSQQNVEPINEEKVVLKSKIERTTTNDVIQIGTSQVKLSKEFNGSIIINDRADTIVEDVSPDRGEEKTDKVVDSKYLQPRWCPPGLTRTQKQKLQRLWLAEMWEREQEKRWDELFDEIKPRTLPKQEWRQKEASQHQTIEPATGGQTATLDGQTTADLVPSSQTAPSGG